MAGWIQEATNMATDVFLRNYRWKQQGLSGCGATNTKKGKYQPDAPHGKNAKHGPGSAVPQKMLSARI